MSTNNTESGRDLPSDEDKAYEDFLRKLEDREAIRERIFDLMAGIDGGEKMKQKGKKYMSTSQRSQDRRRSNRYVKRGEYVGIPAKRKIRGTIKAELVEFMEEFNAMPMD